MKNRHREGSYVSAAEKRSDEINEREVHREPRAAKRSTITYGHARSHKKWRLRGCAG